MELDLGRVRVSPEEFAERVNDQWEEIQYKFRVTDALNDSSLQF